MYTIRVTTTVEDDEGNNVIHDTTEGQLIIDKLRRGKMREAVVEGSEELIGNAIRAACGEKL